MRLVVRGMTEADRAGVLRLSERMYGATSYQASPRYLDWLYAQNPASRGAEDCLVALDRQTVVGFVHRMRLPCVSASGESTVASLQNHVVEPKLRGGAGILLLQRAVRKESYAFSPGVGGRLREAYRRLGYHETNSYWLMRWINPVFAVVQRLGRTATHGRWPAAHLHEQRFQSHRAKRAGLAVTHRPDARQLHRLAEALSLQAHQSADAGAHVTWTPALLQWRYFSPTGPRHLLIERRSSGAWAVLSFGVRAAVTVVRLLEHEAADDVQFLDDVAAVAADLGAALATCYTLRDRERVRLLAAGWWQRADSPASFRNCAPPLSLTGGATDVGLEALLTDVVA